MDRQEADKLNNELERLNDVTYSDRKMVLRYMKNYIDSLVKPCPACTNLCTELNSRGEWIDELMSKQHNKEITKRMIEEYIEWFDDAKLLNNPTKQKELLLGFADWLEKED